MNTGAMRYRAVFLKYVSATDSEGFDERSWEEVCCVWADMVSQTAREYFSSQTETEEEIFKLYLRYREDINNTMRVICDGITLDITAVLRNKRKGMLTVIARRVTQDG